MKDMMRKSVFAAFAAVLLPLAAVSQPKPGAPRAADYHFTTVKANPVTSVKNQYRSGTCWCFSSLSFLESEIMKAKGIQDTTRFPDLSEMFVVRNAYHDRAIKYVRLDGKLNMAAGSDFGDVLDVIATYGIVPQSVFSGMNYGTDLPVQGELDAVLRGYVEAVVRNPNTALTPVWPRSFDGILNAYLGEIPAEFDVDGKTYTPVTYRDELGINTDDFVSITSYTHHPFYKPFAIEVEDNWRWTPSYNLPLDEFMAVIDNAIENGHTVLWGGDVSELGFTRDGIAVLLDPKAAKVSAGSDQERWVGKADEKSAAPATMKELAVTQEVRQEMFDNKTSTDDHGMHLFGTAKDQNGTKYYLIKNSWGETGAFKGIWYMSENFAKAKTLNYVVNRNAIPVDIQKKLGLYNYGKTNRPRR